MELAHLERARSGLLQFLVVLIMIFLGLIMGIAYFDQLGNEIPVLALLGFGACLYVLARERRLKAIQVELLQQLTSKNRQVEYLDRKRREEKDTHQEMEERLRELTDLYRSISAVNAVIDPDETLEKVLWAALELVKGDKGSIMLLQPDGRTLKIVNAVGLTERVIRETRQDVDQGVAGWVVRHQEPVLLKGKIDDDGEGRFDRIADRKEMNVGMSIPLQLRGKILGVLNLGSSNEGETVEFDEKDLRNAHIFAQHASIAIENTHLHTLVEDGGVGYMPEFEIPDSELSDEELQALVNNDESLVLSLVIPESTEVEIPPSPEKVSEARVSKEKVSKTSASGDESAEQVEEDIVEIDADELIGGQASPMDGDLREGDGYQTMALKEVRLDQPLSDDDEEMDHDDAEVSSEDDDEDEVSLEVPLEVDEEEVADKVDEIVLR